MTWQAVPIPSFVDGSITTVPVSGPHWFPCCDTWSVTWCSGSSGNTEGAIHLACQVLARGRNSRGLLTILEAVIARQCLESLKRHVPVHWIICIAGVRQRCTTTEPAQHVVLIARQSNSVQSVSVCSGSWPVADLARSLKALMALFRVMKRWVWCRL